MPGFDAWMVVLQKVKHAFPESGGRGMEQIANEQLGAHWSVPQKRYKLILAATLRSKCKNNLI